MLSLRYLIIPGCLLTGWADYSAAQTSAAPNAFFQPPNVIPTSDNAMFIQNKAYPLGDTIDLLYFYNGKPGYNLTFWQEWAPGFAPPRPSRRLAKRSILIEVIKSNIPDIGNVTKPWTVTNYGHDLSTGSAFYIHMIDPDGKDVGGTTYFNITPRVVTSSSSQLITTTVTAAPTSQTSSPSPTPSGLTHDGKISVALGVVIGVLLLAAIVGGVVLFLRRRKLKRQNAVQNYSAAHQQHEPVYDPKWAGAQTQARYISEVENSSVKAELPAGPKPPPGELP